jgi:hypothetical protein
MKRFLVALSFILMASFLASAFEGIVTVEFFSKEMTNSGKVYIKDMKMKLMPQNQLGGTNGYPIIDFSSQKAIFVFIDNKYYMTLPLDSMIKNLEEDPLTLIESSDVSEVLGYKAKRFYQNVKDKDLTDKDLTVDAWATDEEKLNLNPFVGVQRLGDEGIIVSKAAHFLYKKGFTPLKIVVKDNKGNEIMKVEVKSVTKTEVKPKEFEIPSGYKSLSEYIKEKNKKLR